MPPTTITFRSNGTPTDTIPVAAPIESRTERSAWRTATSVPDPIIALHPTSTTPDREGWGAHGQLELSDPAFDVVGFVEQEDSVDAEVTIVNPERSLVEILADTPRELRAERFLEALAARPGIACTGADLRELDLAGAARERSKVHGGSPRLVLDGVDLGGVILSGSRLSGASLRGAILDNALLVGADLRGADLAGASLRSAHLSGADLTRADLSFCDLRGASLLTAELTCAVATGADMREALLHSATLSGAMLRGADLRWARLNGSRLLNTDLRGARFGGARLTLADLSGARVSDSTDLAYAFLYWARLDRVALTREHIGGGIGESVSDHALARDTYFALMRHFTGERRRGDACWAYCQAISMNTATHRPDRAREYYPRDWAPSEEKTSSDRRVRFAAGARDVRSTLRHGLRWLGGHVGRLTTDHGTSFGRIAATVGATWIAFALFFQASGGIFDIHQSQAPRPLVWQWFDALYYSAAAITPIDAYPLAASSQLGHAAATLEGIVGMMLFGALGYVSASRARRGCG